MLTFVLNRLKERSIDYDLLDLGPTSLPMKCIIGLWYLMCLVHLSLEANVITSFFGYS